MLEEEQESIQPGEPRHRHDLEGALVEIFGLTDAIRPLSSEDGSPESSDTELIFPNSMAGRCLSWSDQDEHYRVLSFDGYLLGIPEAHLREFTPHLRPEDGGFDVCWPESGAGRSASPDGAFPSAEVSEQLALKGYCLIQMALHTDQDIRAAVQQANAIDKTLDWTLPKKEFEGAYLGLENTSKMAVLAHDPRSPDVEEEDTLARFDAELSTACLALEPFCPRLGFVPWGRISGTVRLPLQSDEEEQMLRQPKLSEKDYTDGAVWAHLSFLERRRLMLIHWIDNEGGDFWLMGDEAAGESSPKVRLPLSRNKLLIFRCDKFAYRYAPSNGPSTAIHTFMITAPPGPPEDERVVSLPAQIHGERLHIMSIQGSFSPGGEGITGHWCSFACGIDTIQQIPAARWDLGLYYSEEHQDGFCYTKHGGFLKEDHLTRFDSHFFNLSEDYMQFMGPSQRLVLENGFQALASVGYTKESARGLDCGVFLGDSGSDWGFIQVASHAPSPQLCDGIRNNITGHRLSHTLNLRGPVSITDTACSSSLVAVNLAHTMMRSPLEEQEKAGVDAHVKRAVALGINVLLTVRMYLLYCGPHMLSPRGRCFTFDSTADGYCRGEGCGSILLEMSKSDEDAQEMLACLIGSAVNQDGRSASMTAPNGPSQQQCIRLSMEETALSPKDITVAECHGTGTALGDPIEVSALRMVMQGRKNPILTTSAKANMGHLEACAGIAGLIRCVLMIDASAGAGTAHCHLLNPHMDTNGYPALFISEVVDFDEPMGISGVSSMGFGGTNARADLWGRCLRGPRVVSGINTHEFYEKRAPYFDRVYNNGAPGPHARDRICIAGSWNRFTKLEVMSPSGSKLGCYTARVPLGDVCREQFYILVNGDEEQVIHPVVGNAGPEAEVVGPETLQNDVKSQTHGLRWLIDGYADGAVAGQIYEIKLEWGFSWERGDFKRVSWAKTENLTTEPQYKHCYSVVGSWTSWKFQQMTKSAEDEDLFLANMRIGRKGFRGTDGSEEFFFARDNDWSQIIHPALPRTRKPRVPIRGPDDRVGSLAEPNCKTWLVRAPPSEVVQIQLRVADGEITMGLQTETKGLKTWTNRDDEDWSAYFLTGTMNNWRFSAMAPDPESKGVFRCRFAIGSEVGEEFGIVMEKDWEQQLYPEVAEAGQGEAMVCGPDGKGYGLFWFIAGEVGDTYEVILNMKAADKFSMVTWERVEQEPASAACALLDQDILQDTTALQEWQSSTTDGGIEFWWRKGPDGEVQTRFDNPSTIFE